MRKATRDALNVIEQLLLNDPDTGKEIWNIMTALRGPDETHHDKTATTAVIRAAAFPRMVRENSSRDGHYAYPGGWEYNKQSYVDMNRIAGGHFKGHIRLAVEALGLGDRVPESEESDADRNQ